VGRQKKRDGPVYHTTHQVAKLLGVSLPTVVNWVKNDLLAAHRTPGGHRRIAQKDLLAFARRNDYPLPDDYVASFAGVRRVLVVDDEPDFSETVQDYLTLKGGYEVEVAESGFVAGYTIARFKPDLVLMDIMMPGMDGFEVLRRLRADRDTAHLPVVACTAYRDPEIEARIASEAFDDFIAKPVKLEALLTLVQRMVGPSTPKPTT